MTTNHSTEPLPRDRDDDTVTGEHSITTQMELAVLGGDERPPSREVHILDFKAGATSVRVDRRPVDRSRLWILVANKDVTLYLALDEPIARELSDRLARALVPTPDRGSSATRRPRR